MRPETSEGGGRVRLRLRRRRLRPQPARRAGVRVPAQAVHAEAARRDGEGDDGLVEARCAALATDRRPPARRRIPRRPAQIVRFRPFL